MVKKVLLFVLLVVSGLLRSQTIEVLVEEKVSLKPVDYVYMITFQSASDIWSDLEGLDEYDEDDDGEDLTLDEPNLEDLELELEQRKFNFSRTKKSSNPFGGAEDALRVDLKSTDELKKLEALLESYDNISGYVESATFEPLSSYHETIYPKMIDAAKKEAGILAKSTGRTLGLILAVEEVNDENMWTGLMDIYGKMFRKIGMSNELGFDPSIQEVNIKLRVRFELK